MIFWVLKMKYIIICDDDIDATPSVLTLSYIVNVGKGVGKILLHICTPVNETDLVFDGEMWEIFHLNLLLLLRKYIIIHIVLDVVFDIYPSVEQNCCYCNFMVCVLVI